MLTRQLSSVAAKQLGRATTQRQSTTRSVATLSRASSSLPVAGPDATCTNDSKLLHSSSGSSPLTTTAAARFVDNAGLCRRFSDMQLRRPPPKYKKSGGNDGGETKQKWRSHAVSLGFGNYQDEYEYDDYSDRQGNLERTNRSVGSQASSTPASPSPSSSSSWDKEESELAEQVQEIQREDDERRKRWLENAKPPVRRSVIDERGRAYGRGGRKTASARVWITPGFGNVVVNKKEFVDYFGRSSDRELILEPLAATETLGRFDITATVEGGGLTGQAGAIRHGLARALNHYNPDAYRPSLKRLGYLTRDPRKVERKKIGHLKARKKPQWVKR